MLCLQTRFVSLELYGGLKVTREKSRFHYTEWNKIVITRREGVKKVSNLYTLCTFILRAAASKKCEI